MQCTLRQNISDNESVTNESKYINAEPEKQHTFTEALNNAKEIVNEQQATLDANLINQKAQAILTTKNALTVKINYVVLKKMPIKKSIR